MSQERINRLFSLSRSITLRKKDHFCNLQIGWKITGRIKRTDFLFSLVQKQLLFASTLASADHAEKIAIQLDTLTTVLNSLYGDNWDYTISVETKQLEVCILYKKLTISNSQDQTHEIKDLMVKVDVFLNGPESKLSLSEPTGKRFTITTTENLADYRHSHLSNRSSPFQTVEFSNFCLGSETPIVHSIEAFLSDENYLFDEINLTSYFLNLNGLVEWESLEGGPYVYIEHLDNISNSLLDRLDRQADFSDSVSNVLSYQTLWDLILFHPLFRSSFKIIPHLDSFKLLETENFFLLIIDVIKKLYQLNEKSPYRSLINLLTQKKEGYLYRLSDKGRALLFSEVEKDGKVIFSNYPFIFKDKVLYPTIIPVSTHNSNLSLNNFTLHEDFTNKFFTALKGLFLYKSSEHSRINSRSNSRNI